MGIVDAARSLSIKRGPVIKLSFVQPFSHDSRLVCAGLESRWKLFAGRNEHGDGFAERGERGRAAGLVAHQHEERPRQIGAPPPRLLLAEAPQQALHVSGIQKFTSKYDCRISLVFT